MDKQETQYENSIYAQELKNKLDNNENIIVFDIRSKNQYESGHIPKSAFAVCNPETQKQILPRLPKDSRIVLVGDNDQYSSKMVSFMKSAGLDAVYLKDGMSSWKWKLETSLEEDITAKELKSKLDEKQNLFLIDVREPDEYSEWHISGSTNIPLSEVGKPESIRKIPQNSEIVTICARGNRSKVAKFVLEGNGIHSKSLEGGMETWTTAFETAEKAYVINGKKIDLVQVRRIGKGCMSYVVSSNGEAIVVDPVFPHDEYTEIAKNNNWKITRVYDTHQHADHVSAAKSLAEKTEAVLNLSAYENYNFPHEILNDGQEQKIGDITLKVIHTPGHTLGSLSFLIEGQLLITGDTLFVDGVGRPDLRDEAEEFAPVLYDTLQKKLLVLSGNIHVFPAHGNTNQKGQLSSKMADLIKKIPFLKMSKEDFVKQILSTVMPTPPNHTAIIDINKNGKNLSSDEANSFEIGPNRCSITGK
ncbi:MAG TPA: rhodanese-like domain-containing protein [Nitrosopumilaceae archaeon]|nr:rhodanese-like domain-containing protein [Nitrosopumilaceae archaeon]